MFRLNALALLLAALSAATAYVARPVPLMGSSPAVARATFAKPASFAKPTIRMQETSEGSAVTPADETCIEDEAIEECTLAKWNAGEIKVCFGALPSSPRRAALRPQPPTRLIARRFAD